SDEIAGHVMVTGIVTVTGRPFTSVACATTSYLPAWMARMTLFRTSTAPCGPMTRMSACPGGISFPLAPNAVMTRDALSPAFIVSEAGCAVSRETAALVEAAARGAPAGV